jgi:hypothetical protein
MTNIPKIEYSWVRKYQDSEIDEFTLRDGYELDGLKHIMVCSYCGAWQDDPESAHGCDTINDYMDKHVKSYVESEIAKAKEDLINEIDFAYHHIVENQAVVNVIDDDEKIHHVSVVDPRNLRELFHYIQAKRKELKKVK